jgi:predicted nucleotidyltransferase
MHDDKKSEPISGLGDNEVRVIDHVIEAARAEPLVTRVVLFGSRARRDHGPRSDFDLAVFADTMPQGAWAKFSLDLVESAPTLCGIDLVRITHDTAQTLREAVVRDGKTIYAKAD